MDTTLLKNLLELRAEMDIYIGRQEIDHITKDKILRAMQDIETIFVRIKDLDVEIMDTEEYERVNANLSKAISNIKESHQSLEEIYRVVGYTRQVFNSVLAHVEPDEPWPRR